MKTEDRRALLASRRSAWRSPFVPLERVNPSPSPTHSARQSECAKVEAVFNAATRCSRETELIRGIWIEEQSKDTNRQKGTKQAEEMKKGDPVDCQEHSAYRQVAYLTAKDPVEEWIFFENIQVGKPRVQSTTRRIWLEARYPDEISPRKRAKGIIINEDAVVSKANAAKLPTTSGNAQGKRNEPATTSSEVSSDNEGVYVTHLTTSESEGEHHDLQAAISEHEDDQLLLARRAELCSKRIDDPCRIRVPETPSPPVQDQAMVPVSPAHGAPSRSVKRFKAEGLRTNLDEKTLSVGGLIDQYPEICHTIKARKFEIFIKPWGSSIPGWVQEFYTAYGALVPQGKKKVATFKPVHYIVLRGKR
uniref:Integrase core domain containing protein n=1 Tax=Solanum tuberosum TaxID=4113 RepID=M1DN85_SOLTU